MILAVGRPLILSRLGLAANVEPKVLYRPPDPHDHDGQRIVVLGATRHAAVAAVQLSGANRVSMVFAEPDLGHLEPEVRAPIEALAREGRLGCHPRSTLGGIQRDRVTVTGPDGEPSIENDLVFPFTGVLKAHVGDGATAHAMLRTVGVRLENTWDRHRWISFTAVFVVALGMFAGLALGGASGRILTRIADVAGMVYGYSVDLFLIAIIPIAYYPFLGGKIWCRHWCPTAAAMHLLSGWFGRRGLSRYRIDSDKQRCIDCNMCTRFCEVGIDVRRFALKGESLGNTNSSCIGCGICITVCPTAALTFGTGPSARLPMSAPLERHGQTTSVPAS